LLLKRFVLKRNGWIDKMRTKDSVAEHRSKSANQASVAVVTLSSSRTLATDQSGDIIQSFLELNGHKVVARMVLKDNRTALKSALSKLMRQEKVQAIITSGGTGLSPTDITIETVRGMLDKELPGFSALFMQLSYPQVKSAAMLSRALAGAIKGKMIFCLPGSPRACKLAMESLILPELGHMLMILGS
jgi:molybdopterin adenylyltransferase